MPLTEAQIEERLLEAELATRAFSSFRPMRESKPFKAVVAEGKDALRGVFLAMAKKSCSWAPLIAVTVILGPDTIPIPEEDHGRYERLWHHKLSWAVESGYLTASEAGITPHA